MSAKQKLELTWIGKDQRPRLEPRVLVSDSEKSHLMASAECAATYENIIIKGDNLLALKSLESTLVGRVKCVYIDPPYNTGTAFRSYEDGVAHSLWLSLMRDRIAVLHRLLADDGIFFCQLDDNEGHYAKVIIDECFGRGNFITTIIWQKVDSPNDNKSAISPDHEYVFMYAKNKDKVKLKQKSDPSIVAAYPLEMPDGRRARDRLLKKNGKNSLRQDRPSMYFPIPDPDGVDVYPVHDDGRDARWSYGKDSVLQMIADSSLIWKNRGSEKKAKWIPYTREYAPDNPSRPYQTIWTDVLTTRQAKAHQKTLLGPDNIFDTPKSEPLMMRLIEMSTNPGDIVLDSFAGSGTTGAVAHKMGRRWVMVELGEHCHTHIIPRLKKVIDGDDPGGITEAVGWKGGGGFRYFTLGPSLITQDEWGRDIIAPAYRQNSAMLIEAMCKLHGYTFKPSESHFWLHGQSTERDFIYVTTQPMTKDQVAAISDEVGPERTLLICCGSHRLSDPQQFPNITVEKIPKSVLEKCEWGKDDYSLKIRNLPVAEEFPEVIPEAERAEAAAEATKRKRGRPHKAAKGDPGQASFFDATDATETK